MARRLVRLFHAYAGLALSLLLLVFAVTGAALVYKEAYWRAVYPELRAPAPALDAADHAAAVAAARRQLGDGLRTVKFPEPGVAAYHLYLADGEAFLSADDHRVIDRWGPRDRAMAFLFDLHAHLMAGDTGERVGGVVSLLGFVLGVTGLVLWWPTRRRFSLAATLPRSLARRALLHSHRDVGALTSPVLLVVLLSGAGLVFYGTAQRVLNGAFGDDVPARAVVAGPEDLAGTLADARMIAGVQEAFPGSRIVFYYPPGAGMTVHEFRLKQPCELHPNGRSYAFLDGEGRLLRRTDACAMPPGERTLHAFYPLHAGKAGSHLYKAAVLVSGLALALLAATGVATYLMQIRRA